MDPLSTRLALGAAGAAGGAAAGLGVEDVFSTYLYEGTGSTQTITNGIDLSGEGGLVWLKRRETSGYNHLLTDTVRGADKYLSTDLTDAEQSGPYAANNFSSTGFDVPGGDGGNNGTGNPYVSWTFRKAPGFFDVVTYTGTGSATTISHNLGSVPGCIFVKRLDATAYWYIYHSSLGNTKILKLPSTGAAETQTTAWNSTSPTSSVFTVGSHGNTNALGGSYVAYLFAHDEAIFGESGSESVIQCGSFAHTNGTVPSISLGYEPQWVLIKNTTGSGSWLLFDNMRGMPVGSSDSEMYANSSAAESNTTDWISPNATGFTLPYFSLLSSNTFIYIAIRRGPMKTPTDATDVMHLYYANPAADGTSVTTGFPVDMCFQRTTSSSGNWGVVDRMRGLARTSSSTQPLLSFNSSDAEFATASDMINTAWNTGYTIGGNRIDGFAGISHTFRRAPGFFDVVAYTGTGSDLTVNHNLGKAPELIIARNRSTGTGRWYVYPGPLSSSEQKHFRLNETLAVSSSANLDWAPTSTTFNADTFLSLSTSGTTYIAYLFASCPGVSKVGSYTGTGSNINVDCGFSAGARFVLIKRTDSTGDWYVWDTARGIVSGNDPYLLLNTTDAEVTTTDYIDPLNAGFTVTSSAPAALNASGGSYIFLAIA